MINPENLSEHCQKCDIITSKSLVTLHYSKQSFTQLEPVELVEYHMLWLSLMQAYYSGQWNCILCCKRCKRGTRLPMCSRFIQQWPYQSHHQCSQWLDWKCQHFLFSAINTTSRQTCNPFYSSFITLFLILSWIDFAVAQLQTDHGSDWKEQHIDVIQTGKPAAEQTEIRRISDRSLGILNSEPTENLAAYLTWHREDKV